jgi:hypothetical protein
MGDLLLPSGFFGSTIQDRPTVESRANIAEPSKPDISA